MSCICGECIVCERDQERAFTQNYMNGLYGRPQAMPLDGNGDWEILMIQSTAGWLAGDGTRRWMETDASPGLEPAPGLTQRLLRTTS